MKLTFNRNTLKKLQNLDEVMESDALLIVDAKDKPDVHNTARVYIDLETVGNGVTEFVKFSNGNVGSRYKRTGRAKVTVVPERAEFGDRTPAVTTEFETIKEAQEFFTKKLQEIFVDC